MGNILGLVSMSIYSRSPLANNACEIMLNPIFNHNKFTKHEEVGK